MYVNPYAKKASHVYLTGFLRFVKIFVFPKGFDSVIFYVNFCFIASRFQDIWLLFVFYCILLVIIAQ